MKKFVNDPRDLLLRESLEGLALAHPDIVHVSLDPPLVVRADAPVAGKVGIISGGGSGHEPLPSGFVGSGMLDAAVPVLNFELAAELAADIGIEVRTVVVEDDVAVAATATMGRRGVAGAMLVEKIAGAAAERGDSLAGVSEIAVRTAAGVRTMGLALQAGTAPHTGRATFDLGVDEIELGVGIHGEPGRRRMPLTTADELTDLLVDAVLEELGLEAGAQVLVLVNGFGATPLAELYVMYRRARRRLEERGAVVARSLVGELVTSLDMAGASVTVLPLDAELMDLYDAPVHTAGLRWRA